MCHAYRESTRFTPPFYDFAKAARDGWVYVYGGLSRVMIALRRVISAGLFRHHTMSDASVAITAFPTL